MKSLFLIVTLAATAFVCAREASEVVERLPQGFSKQAARLRAAIAHPMTAAETTQLAREYLDEGRANADIGLVNISASLLEPLAAKTNAPATTLLTLAMCESYAHDFTNALVALHRASASPETRRESDLQSISILITLGRFAEARAFFGRNPSLLSDARGITLLALLTSNTGQLEASYTLLKSKHESWTNDPPEETRWRLGILAEMAERLGKFDGAEQHYQTALSLPGPDLFTSVAWLNFLISNNRTNEAANFADASPLRVKLVLWKTAAQPTTADIRALEEQFARKFIHQREHAFFLLNVKHAAREALDVALQNWVIQKEPIDLQLVIESALAAQQPEQARQAIAWMTENKFQDARLAAFMNRFTL